VYSLSWVSGGSTSTLSEYACGAVSSAGITHKGAEQLQTPARQARGKALHRSRTALSSFTSPFLVSKYGWPSPLFGGAVGGCGKAMPPRDGEGVSASVAALAVCVSRTQHRQLSCRCSDVQGNSGVRVANIPGSSMKSSSLALPQI
jgi:hypothetical protein